MQGFNRRIPPDYDPAKHPTLNAVHGKHALGVRASKLKHGGGLIVRFELPFNIWCGGCNAHIGQGVRFNAEKIKVGNYYTTPIYEFKCKCHVCAKQMFTIRTDPQNTQYVVTEGARRKNEEWDPEEVGGLPIRDDSGKPVEEDAFAAVEKGLNQKAQAMNAAQRLEALEAVNDDNWSDPYTHSKRLRRAFREEKKVRQAVEAKDEAIRDRYGLGREIKLIAEKPEEAREAAEAFRSGKRAHEAEDSRKRRRIEAGTSSIGKLVRPAVSVSAADSLKARLLTTSRSSTDPFASAGSNLAKRTALLAGIKR